MHSSFLRKHGWKLLVAILLVAAVAFLTWRLWPLSTTGIQRCAVVVERQAWVELRVNGKPVAYAAAVGDNEQRAVALQREDAMTVTRMEGFWVNRTPWWPSCRGTLVVGDTVAVSLPADGLRSFVETAQRSFKQQLTSLQSKDDELKYFLRVHGVSDPGFNRVSAEQARVDSAIAHCQSVLATLDTLGANNRVALALTDRWTAYWHNALGRLDSTTCEFRSQTLGGKLMLLQTENRHRPMGCDAESLWPWDKEADGDVVAVGFNGLSEPSFATLDGKPVIVPGNLKQGRHDFPRIQVADGAPVFTQHGNYVGVVVGKQVYPRSVVRQLFKNR